jgi:CelD/BcsL family acetyltransferase involved in cellulose biosynthesis
MQLKIYPSFSDELIAEIINNKDDYIVEPFLDPEWINIWWKNIGINEYSEIKYFVFTKDDNPKIIIPLVTRKFFYLKLVEIAGGKVSDYLSPIFNKKYNFSQNDLNFISQEILKYFNDYDLVFFRKQKKYSNFSNPLLFLDKPILGLHKCYSIRFDKFSKNKKIKKIYNDNRRQIKKLGNIGEVKFINAYESDEKKKILETMIEQKEERYKQTNVWNMFGLNYYKNFYYDLIKSDFNFLKLHISAIKVGNNLISTHFGFVNNKTFYYLMPSFDNKKFKSYSSGNILLENLINYTQSKNIDVFDFTIGNENYKKKWTNETNDLFDVILTNSFFGKLFKFIILIIFFLKRINYIDKLYKKIYKLLNR